jgi:hypothetical protein
VVSEWVGLLLLAVVLVLPAVALLAFAGCDVVFGLDYVEPELPSPPLVDADGTGSHTIQLTWTFNAAGYAVERFEVERTKVGSPPDPPLNAAGSPFDDTGLEEGTRYSYRVRAILTGTDPTDWSNPVEATTRMYANTFEAALTSSEVGWGGYTLVQRIEAVRLTTDGTQVRVTLRAGAGEAYIDRMYISQPAEAGDPYDSSADFTAVSMTRVVVPANSTAVVGPIDYVLDQTKPLLIAVDFAPSPDPDSVIAFDESVATDAVAYYQDFNASAPQAMNADRDTGYPSESRIYLVEKIEVV